MNSQTLAIRLFNKLPVSDSNVKSGDTSPSDIPPHISNLTINYLLITK